MRKLMLPILVLIASLFACKDSPQNSGKQKEVTQGSSPANSTTATGQQNYGAGTNANKPSAQQDPSHTDNLTNPAPAAPTPQAEGSAQQQSTTEKQSGARDSK